MDGPLEFGDFLPIGTNRRLFLRLELRIEFREGDVNEVRAEPYPPVSKLHILHLPNDAGNTRACEGNSKQFDLITKRTMSTIEDCNGSPIGPF